MLHMTDDPPPSRGTLRVPSTRTLNFGESRNIAISMLCPDTC